MDAKTLYDYLERLFITPALSDSWAEHMRSIEGYLTDNFKQRSMGLVCDNTHDIRSVYTAVFPSTRVLDYLFEKNVHDALLFVHHPVTWDIRKSPEVWDQMSLEQLEGLRERRIAVYNLHVPLDNYGPYSTSTTLASAIGIKCHQSFAPYFGAMCGVIGTTELTTIEELQSRFEQAVGHKVGLYAYGDSELSNRAVAVVAGGGNDVDILKEVVEARINTLVTGITALNDHSRSAHEYARTNRINLLGGTHYSTEKFACIRLVDLFSKLGLHSEFVVDEPLLEDL